MIYIADDCPGCQVLAAVMKRAADALAGGAGAVVGAGSVLAVGSSVALYKKDAAFRSRLNAAQEAGQATVTYQGTTYKVPKKKIPLPIPKPKTTFSKFNKGKKIPYTERFKEIEQEKKAKK